MRNKLDPQFIRDKFAELSQGHPISIRRLERELIYGSLRVEEEVIDHWALVGCHKDIADALKAEDENGLPYAKPLTSGLEPVWQQLRLFNYLEMCGLIAREMGAVEQDYNKAMRLVDYCLHKFGKAPNVPDFRPSEASDGPRDFQ